MSETEKPDALRRKLLATLAGAAYTVPFVATLTHATRAEAQAQESTTPGGGNGGTDPEQSTPDTEPGAQGQGPDHRPAAPGEGGRGVNTGRNPGKGHTDDAGESTANLANQPKRGRFDDPGPGFA